MQVGFASQQFGSGFQPQPGMVFAFRALCRIERPVHHAEAPKVVLLVQCGIHFDLSFQPLYVFPVLLEFHFADNRQFEFGFHGYRETPEVELAMEAEYFAEKPVIHIQFASRIDQLAVFDGKILAAKEYLLVAVVYQVTVFFFRYKSANGVERCRGFGFYLQEPEKFGDGQQKPFRFVFVQRIERDASQAFYPHVHGNFFHFALLCMYFQRI